MQRLLLCGEDALMESWLSIKTEIERHLFSICFKRFIVIGAQLADQNISSKIFSTDHIYIICCGS